MFILEEPCELICQVFNQSMPGAGSTSSSSTATGASSSSTSSTATTGATTAAVTSSTNTPDVSGGGSGGSSSNSSNGSSSSHHSPYDLRRKSPPHHYAAASTSGTPLSSVSASTNYSALMLPARKRPRRTCSVTNESEYWVGIVTFDFIVLSTWDKETNKCHMMYLIQGIVSEDGSRLCLVRALLKTECLL